MTGSNNSPAKVVSRLMHRDKASYFKHMSGETIMEWWPAIWRHVERCQHSYCRGVRGF